MIKKPSVYYAAFLGAPLALVILISSCNAPQPPSLPSLKANHKEISVSGLSSGGFMAVQLHVSHSQSMKGVGVFAGGPYKCSKGSYTTALSDCMNPPSASKPEIGPLVEETKNLAKQNKIDAIENLKTTKVWLFSGKKDTIVHPQVMNHLETFYKAFVPTSDIKYLNNLEAGHAMITQNYGGACAVNKSPFINNCGLDGAGQVLQHIYGPLNQPSQSLKGKIVEFDQSEFTTPFPPSDYSLAKTGYAYIPESCRSTSCHIHIFFHGCLQNSETIGRELVEHAGYNEWADSNNIIILYPQTKKSIVNPVNPMGCWDWWGYSSHDYYSKDAPQIKSIMKMVHKLTQ